MGKMQEAMRKAQEARSRKDPAPAETKGLDAAPGQQDATATAIAIGPVLRDGEVDPHLVAIAAPRSPVAEQYRTLRGNLLALSADAPPKAVVVTSPGPHEGRSVTAINLAASLAELGDKRVVAVDADLRRPSVHRLLGLDNQRGIADYLAGGTMLEMVLQRSRTANLWALPSGRVPPNPPELLGGKRMDDLLERLRREFDFVVFDTPAVGDAEDAAVLAPRCDAVLLVVRIGATPRAAAAAAVEALAQARANVVGTVLTGLADEAGYYVPSLTA